MMNKKMKKDKGETGTKSNFGYAKPAKGEHSPKTGKGKKKK